MSTHRPIDRRRQDVFLDVLRQTGSISGAAAAATPHGEGDRPGYRSFLDLMKRDPEFAREVEEAKNHALGRVEQEISRRAFTPDERPIFAKDGTLLGVHRDHRNANQMLLRLAERLSDDWSPKKHVTGEVEHKHLHAHAVFQLELEHLELLHPDERERFVSLLSLIEERSREPERLPEGGAAATHHRLPGPEVARPLPARPADPADDDRAGGNDDH